MGCIVQQKEGKMHINELPDNASMAIATTDNEVLHSFECGHRAEARIAWDETLFTHKGLVQFLSKSVDNKWYRLTWAFC